MYEGEFFNGKYNGRGKYYLSGELYFEGEYKYGKKIRGIMVKK